MDRLRWLRFHVQRARAERPSLVCESSNRTGRKARSDLPAAVVPAAAATTAGVASAGVATTTTTVPVATLVATAAAAGSAALATATAATAATIATAAAAAAVAAAATTTAAAAAEAAAAAAARTFLTWTSFVHFQRSAVDLEAVQFFNGRFAFFSILHLDEAKATGATSLSIGHVSCTGDAPELDEQVLKFPVGQREREVTNVNVHHCHLNLGISMRLPMNGTRHLKSAEFYE